MNMTLNAYIPEITVQSWDHACKIARSLMGWSFRGQDDASRKLESRLERQLAGNSYASKLIGNREAHMIKQFRNLSYLFAQMPESDTPNFDALALIQHHGGPTRLLDFTRSFYAAAFFAMENARTDAAVWAFNHLRWINIRDTVSEMRYGDMYVDEINEAHLGLAEVILSGKNDQQEKGIYSLHSRLLNERIIAQQGCFLFPCDISASMESNFLATVESEKLLSSVDRRTSLAFLDDGQVDSLLLKIVLPKSLHLKALMDMRAMNVTAATLFPGIDGFARSLGFHLRELELNVLRGFR
jgi:hypothetical protein